jgi:hypothetical protein
MIFDLIPPSELARIEAKADALLSTARGTIALDPDETTIGIFIRTIEMLDEIRDTHEVTADRYKATQAHSAAAYHLNLARYARQIRAERLIMLEFLL